MTTDTICLKEADIIRLIQAYLGFRGLHLSLDTLERETGIINSQYPEEALVLRHLIMDGRWRDVLHYIAMLPLGEEDMKFMTFEIMKQKYVELICVYEELGNELYDDLGNAIALCFSELSTYCPCPVEYENLRKLASLTKLSQDSQYKDWNPISSRRQCFQTVCSVLLEMQGIDGEFTEELIDPKRLPGLLVKGILYESCEEYCESKASAQSESTAFRFGGLIRDMQSKSSDLNLYSWLQSVPWVTMSHTFLNRSLTVKVDHLEQPSPKFSWTEKILQNCTDLPEDIASELRRPVSSTEDLKEIFWNRRIEDNLIVDAPQILRRAEEVISRWERRNSTDRSPTDNDTSKDKRRSDIRQMPGCDGDSEDVPKQSSNEKTEKLVTRSISEVRNEREMVYDAGNCGEEKSDLVSSVSSVRLNSSVKQQQLNNMGSNIISKSCIVENKSIVDSVYFNEQDKPFDDKQNIRDLLEAKDKVRSKLLQILKNSTQDKDQRPSVDELKDSLGNLEDPFTKRNANREDVSKDVQHPFFMQPHLLREEEGSIQRVFKRVPEGIDYASSSAKTEKERKQKNIRSTSPVDIKKKSQNLQQLSARDTNRLKRESSTKVRRCK